MRKGALVRNRTAVFLGLIVIAIVAAAVLFLGYVNLRANDDEEGGYGTNAIVQDR